MRRVRLLLSTKSSDDWVNRGQLQSQVWLSIHPISVFCLVGRDNKPFSNRYVVANGRRKRVALSESDGYSPCLCIQKSNNENLLKSDFNVSSQDNSKTLLLTGAEILRHVSDFDGERVPHPVVDFG